MCRVRETSINEHFDEWLLALLLMQILGNICEVRNKKKQKLQVFYKCNEWIKKYFVIGDLRSLTLTTHQIISVCVYVCVGKSLI